MALDLSCRIEILLAANEDLKKNNATGVATCSYMDSGEQMYIYLKGFERITLSILQDHMHSQCLTNSCLRALRYGSSHSTRSFTREAIRPLHAQKLFRYPFSFPSGTLFATQLLIHATRFFFHVLQTRHPALTATSESEAISNLDILTSTQAENQKEK